MESNLKDQPKSHFAGFWKRLGAFIIDVMLFYGGISLIGMASGAWMPRMELSADGDTINWEAFHELQKIAFINICIGIFMFSLYVIISHKKWGQTLGKKALSIKVVTLNGNHPNYINAVTRFFSYLLLISMLLLGVDMMSHYAAIKAGAQTSGTNPSIYILVMTFTAFWYAFSAICIPLNKRRRTLHDFLAKTVVIKA